MRNKASIIFGLMAVGSALWVASQATTWAAGPIETSPYAVQGVEVDATDLSAKAAKDKALVDVQIKALVKLAERIGDAEAAATFAKLEPKQVMPLLRSLSIEEETISPGRYQGKFTVRFLPSQIKPLLSRNGIRLPDEQGPPMMVIPVWTDENGRVLVWESNPWRQAWLDAGLAQAQIPILVPLGDREDTNTLSSTDVTANNAVKLEAVRRRYDVKTMLLAFAQPAPDGGVHVRLTGSSPLGKISIDKVYTADSKSYPDSARLAAQRFEAVVTEKFKTDQAKAAEKKAASEGPRSFAVSIPFAGPSQWNGLRSRILSTPGVVGLEVTGLDGGGASAKLTYNGPLDDLASSFRDSGLRLSQSGGGWMVSAL